jgi:hypothetical protein
MHKQVEAIQREHLARRVKALPADAEAEAVFVAAAEASA